MAIETKIITIDLNSEKPCPEDKTDYERLKKMTQEEIEQNALDDPDAQPLTDADIARIKQVLDERKKIGQPNSNATPIVKPIK